MKRPISFEDAVEICVKYMRGRSAANLAVDYLKHVNDIHNILSGRTHKGAQERAVELYNKHGAKYGLKPKLSVRHKM